jgi:GR25 family glycosyltransferase involved in LPS biosynthesis
MNDLDIENLLDKYKATIYDVVNSNKKTFINTRIKKIFVINLADNLIRRNYILVLMKKYNINFSLVVVNRINDKLHSFISNKKITKEELGCTLSHLWCLREIIKKKYQNAIIFEDDIIFHKNFKAMFVEIFKNEYDFLLLGACDFSFQSMNKHLLLNEIFSKSSEIKILDDTSEEIIAKPQIKVKNMYRPHENSVKLYGAHANYYSLDGAKFMYENNCKNVSFFDKDYMPMFNNFYTSSFICYPNLVITDISWSNLQHCYPFFSKAEEIYYANCFDNFKFTDYNYIYLDIIFKNQGVKIKDDDTYETYMSRVIKTQFSSAKERDIIKKRLVLDFFTISDLKKMRKNI